ncbi:FKBP-type peptidyl-prolyl cis-trans isomerase [Mangrovimicrobium sediminis]|uniref:FKBP-type peptidyl-prolyl cis-trans isomerase n=1 Tax=Mangrovimicrobium sediminis TaxID=2562682 RepID=UPI0014369274|nr:peptidylprolyl isomerase [Haliea sp. SAOS-164]
MKVADGRVVLLEYEVSDQAHGLLDSSGEDAPLVYIHGTPGVLPLLQSALDGKSIGDVFDVTIAPQDAYGEHNPAAVQEVSRSQFPEGVDLQPGMQVSSSGGPQLTAVITQVTEDKVTLDANHPLAGRTLRFQGKVIEVREASEEELAAVGRSAAG